MSNQSLRNIVLGVALIFFPASAYASIAVTEIMYDAPGSDSGHEWIEIQNSGTAPIELKNWKLSEGGTNHKLVPISVSIVPAGAYAVIAGDPNIFRVDYPAFSGILFDSTFSLGNTGDSFSFLDASSTLMASATFSSSAGAAGDGNSLNFINGAWVPRTPSPGAPVSATAMVPPSKVTATKVSKTSGNSNSAPAVNTTGSAGNAGTATKKAFGSAPAATAGARPNSGFSGILPWILGLSAVIMVGAGALFFLPQKQTPMSIDEYEIIEEKS